MDDSSESEPSPGRAPRTVDRRLASRLRRNLHLLAQKGDVIGVREAIFDLYQADDAPFAGVTLTAAAFGPLVEAAALAVLYDHAALAEELRLDVKHLHKAFGVGTRDVERIEAALDSFCDAGETIELRDDAFCSMLQPCQLERLSLTRHANLFVS